MAIGRTLAVVGTVATASLLGTAGLARADLKAVVDSARTAFFDIHGSYTPRSMEIVVSTGNGSITHYGYNSNATDIYAIASLTKPFTSMLAVMQDQDGDMTLDTDLAQWVSTRCPTHLVCIDPNICIQEPLPGCPRETSTSITLRDLADMYSGLARDPPAADTSKQELYSLVFSGQCTGNPALGSQTEEACADEGAFNYSNWGYAVLGNVLADYWHGDIGDENGSSYWPELLVDRITQPLGLTSTMTGASDGTPPDGARTGYHCTGDGMDGTFSNPCPVADTAAQLNVEANWAGGALWSDATDMGTWLNVNLGNFSAVDPSPSAGMRTAVKTIHSYVHPGTQVQHGCSSSSTSWGLGWVFVPLNIPTTGENMNMMYKDGEIAGFMSYMAMLPADLNTGSPSRGVVVMVNFDNNPDESCLEDDLNDVGNTILQQMVVQNL